MKWMNGTMLSSFVEARQGEYGGVHMNLYYEGME
jgi:hypothetical protein